MAKASKTNKIVLINKTEGQRVCPLVTDVPEQGYPRTKNYIVSPGVNAPRDRAGFETACENKQFKRWVDAGDVYELTQNINEWTEDHATAMMKRTSEIEGLRWWLKTCTSPKIGKKLEALIADFESMYRSVKKSG